MVKSAIVVIDDDGNFLDRFRDILFDLGLLNEYEYLAIEARGKTPADVANHCINEVNRLLEKRVPIAMALVDIVIIERGGDESPKDRSGLEIARRLHIYDPQFPIVAITRYHKAHRLLSEVSLDPYLEGILLKPFIEDDQEFSRRVFLDIVAKATAKPKMKQLVAYAPTSHGTKRIEGRFALQDDARCKSQVQEIGTNDFMALIEELFLESHGTITYMRPGFSGSYLFKVTAKSSNNASQGSTEKWVVKIDSNEGGLARELQRYLALDSRVQRKMYPKLKNDKLSTSGKWSAIAFDLQSDAITFHEYFAGNPSSNRTRTLIDKSLIPFLKEHYGEGESKQCFLWETFYEFEDRIKASILAFLDDARSLMPTRLTKEYSSTLDRISHFVKGPTEEAIYNFEGDFDTRLIHGDLHSRNVLVSRTAEKLVFIDFANTEQSHFMKDVAKLETDILFHVMDSTQGNQTDWARLPAWDSLLALFVKDKVFSLKPSIEDEGLQRVSNLIAILRNTVTIFSSTPSEKEYLIALFHFTLKVLTYRDVSIQKKVFAIHLVNVILDLLDDLSKDEKPAF
jgi:hypothetical protein